MALQLGVGVRLGTNAHHVVRSYMADFHPRCPKCDKVMDRGHLPDALDHASAVLAKWVQGAPEERRFLGGLKVHADDGIPLAAYRCPGCGYVELYARPA